MTYKISHTGISHLSPAPLLQFLMVQPRPTDLPYIFPDRDHTHSPHLWLLGLKSMDGGAEKCYIRKISYFKDRKPSFHEFLLMEIMHPCSVQVSLAITERTPKESDHYTSKQALSPSIYGRAAAHDTVRLPAGPHISKRSSRNKLAELTFEPNKLPLLNLAILLTVVSQHAPNYDVWDYQCYWYADTIYQSVKALFEPANEHIELALSKRRRKYLLGLPLPKGSVGPILEEYKMAMEKYQTEKITKERARRDKEKKVGSLDSKAVLCAHVLAGDRAGWPRYGETRVGEGKGQATGIREERGSTASGNQAEIAGTREKGAGIREECAGKQNERVGGAAVA